ncbi:MAG: hypothetical protein LLF83_00820 [Methanobacterium sp.]|nr:hypothetical protein [Methanobacterium sp.]
MIKNANIIIFIGLLVLVVFVSGCTTNNNSTNQSNKEILLQIISSSSWTGNLTYNGTNYNIEGSRNKVYHLGTNPGHVTISVKKNDDIGNLTVRLLQGTNILQTQSIYSHQEVLNLNYNF